MRYYWKICANSSQIEFSLRFYQVGLVKGYIKVFDGEIQAGAEFEDPEIRIRLASNSISTLNDELDSELLSQRLMSADNFPFIYFISKGGWRLSQAGIRELTGQLRLKNNVDIITLLVTSISVKATQTKFVAQYNLTTSIVLSRYGFEKPDLAFGNEVNVNIRITLFAFRNAKNTFQFEKKSDI